MNRVEALIGSALFFCIAPGSIAGLIPWWITGWRIGDGFPIAGGILIALSFALLIECFIRFALRGGGTPAPVAPTQHLVVTGFYRHVRNPMYVAVLGLIFGQMLLFGSAALLAYGVIVWMAFFIFVVAFEEPRLKREFPEEYAAYFANVPRWLPRLTPWKGG
jgi:protein-S-isoprenylcysteine O-methyltransferase Ste14